MNLLYLLRPTISGDQGQEYLATAEKRVAARLAHCETDPRLLPRRCSAYFSVVERNPAAPYHYLRATLPRIGNQNTSITGIDAQDSYFDVAR